MKFLLLLTLLFSTSAFSADDVNAIMKKAHLAAYYAGNDGTGQLLMKVYPKNGKPIKKMFKMLRIDLEEGGRQMFFTYFTAPSDIKRTTFLVHKNVSGDDFRRLYIPASDKVIAIAGSRKQDPFMGSDFTYEDVSGRHFSKDTHKLLGSETVGGEDCFVTESTPKKAGDDIYSKLKAWISKKTYIAMKVEFYGKDGLLMRTYTSGKIKMMAGHPTILKREMISTAGTKTVILVIICLIPWLWKYFKVVYSFRWTQWVLWSIRFSEFESVDLNKGLLNSPSVSEFKARSSRAGGAYYFHQQFIYQSSFISAPKNFKK